MKGAAALFVLAGCATLAAAQQPEATKTDTARGRTIATQVCAACHGVDGNSPSPANPKLAGQVPEYVTKQLADFKSNRQRKNAIMAGMAAPLSKEDMKSLGAYFGEQKPMQDSAHNKDTVALARKIWRGGDTGRGLAACAGCHGPAGTGLPAEFPRLAGQHAEYTEAQLKLFRSGERANDPNGMMRDVASKLSDAEIKALADYIAGLH
jgi:cytochrome c553